MVPGGVVINFRNAWFGSVSGPLEMELSLSSGSDASAWVAVQAALLVAIQILDQYGGRTTSSQTEFWTGGT